VKSRFRAEVKRQIERVVNTRKVTSGLHYLIRNRTAFLGYHGVSPASESAPAWTLVSESSFRVQMQYIREWFNCISIDEALADRSQRKTKPAAVVTFDDGYANNLEVALPILEEYRIPAIVYITTGNVLDRDLFWPDVIWMVAGKASPVSVDLSGVGSPLSGYVLNLDEETYVEEVLRLLEDIKKIPAERRKSAVEMIVKRIDTRSGGRAPYPPVEGHAFTPLTAEQVARLARHPLITIGAHTHCHNLLDQIPLQQAEETIIQSKQILEEITGTAVHHFAYPNGNFNDNIVRIVRAAGFRSAVTFDRGFFSSGVDPYRTRRFGIACDTSMSTFATMLTGVFLLKKWKGIVQ
jgi:peptidoglycan/xylan/chitin deacetylase (PgdA/CDA1 family)